MESESSKPPLKPCRACHDFKTWSKMKDDSLSENQKKDGKPVSDEKTQSRLDCPLDRDELGRSTWGFLHTMAAYYPEKPSEKVQRNAIKFYKLFASFYPCDVCAADLKEQIERFPPKTESQHELSQWLCRVHNRINLRLGKPQFNCSKVNERWKDGWLDGSCD